MSENERIEHYLSSGNVYADLGYENAEEMKAKSRLVSAIDSVMEHRGIGDADVAAVLGIQPSEVYRVRCGHFRGLSIETLQRGLETLQKDLRPVSDSGGGGLSGGGRSGGVPLVAAGSQRE